MLRLLQVALGLLIITYVADTNLHAQRAGSGGHAGVASHGSPSFASGARSFALAPRSFAPASKNFAPAVRSANQPGRAPFVQNHHQNQHQHPYGERHGVGYRTHYPYFYSGYPGLLSFGYGLPFGYGNDQEETAPQTAPDFSNAPPVDNSPEIAANDAPMFRPAYQPQSAAVPVHAQPATTLVFRDGRPSTQVHNYALTGSTLYALDGETRQEIPLSQLDVPATIEANRKNGVDFALPTSH